MIIHLDIDESVHKELPSNLQVSEFFICLSFAVIWLSGEMHCNVFWVDTEIRALIWKGKQKHSMAPVDHIIILSPTNTQETSHLIW